LGDGLSGAEYIFPLSEHERRGGFEEARNSEDGEGGHLAA